MAASGYRMPLPQRRRALRLGYANGALWAVGNGLTSGSLVYYLALDLGAEGLAVSWILAAPALVGLLRLVSPLLIQLLGDARRTCLVLSLAGYVLLLGLPTLTLPGWAPPRLALPGMVVLLCAHQLFEYIGLVAFWSWMADLVPRRVRGRYFGRRQMWNLAALIPALLAGGFFADRWKAAYQDTPWELLAYGLPAFVGAGFLLASLLPLWRMPATRPAPARAAAAWNSLLGPLADRRYWRLLLFGVWFSAANGITQTAQVIYPYHLGLAVVALAAMRTTMRLGQVGVAAWAGPFSDRFGNRPTLVLCQAIVAAGPAFFLIATPAQPYWIWAAWLAWAAYAGMNVCLPNLMLRLAPTRDNAAYVATYWALTNAVYFLSTVAGGALFNALRDAGPWEVWGATLDRFQVLFLAGWIARTAAVLPLLLIVEPGAWRWKNILFRAPRTSGVKTAAARPR